MSIDLSNRNVAELVFDADSWTRADFTLLDSLEAAASVVALDASRNKITRVVGLGAVFDRLVELNLSHNALAVASTPPYITRQHARHAATVARRLRGAQDTCGGRRWQLCSGMPGWIAALPPSLEVLNVSHNHLSSLATCSCGQGEAEAQMGEAILEETEVAAGEYAFLRHACPLTLSLFFPPSQFPRLRRLDLSHNALAVSLRESDEMEEAWLECLGSDEAALSMVPACCAAEVDFSFNPGVASVNCLLLCSTESGSEEPAPAPRLVSLSLEESGVDDLVGLSGISLYAPRLTHLELHPTPLSRAVGTASEGVLAGFLEALVLPPLLRGLASPPSARLPASEDAQLHFSPSLAKSAVTKALRELTAHHLSGLDEALRRAASATGSVASHAMMRTGGGGSLSALSTFIYASLLLEVIPSLQRLDRSLDVRQCREASMCAVQAALVSRRSRSDAQLDLHGSSNGKPRHVAPPDQQAEAAPLQRQPSLSTLAAVVTPQLRSRVVLTDPSQHRSCSGRASDVPGAERDDSHTSPPAIPASEDSGGDAESSASSSGANAGHAAPSRFQVALDALKPLVPKADAASLTALHGEPEAPTPVQDDSQMDWFTPASVSLDPDIKARYESLCAEAQRLEEDLLRARERREGLSAANKELKAQLAEDRRLIADQRKEVARLRAGRDELRERTQTQRTRLRKRRKDVAYGVDAMRSQAAAAHNRARARQLEERERALEKKEKEWQRRMAQSGGALAVHYSHTQLRQASAGDSHAERPVRSVVLREAATREKMKRRSSIDPLAYAPRRFQDPIGASEGQGSKPRRPRAQPDASAPRQSNAGSGSRRPFDAAQVMSSPSGSGSEDGSALRAALEQDEETYFRSFYPQEEGEGNGGDGALQAAANEYCHGLSTEQRQQLQEAVLSSGPRSPFGSNSRRGSRAVSPVPPNPLPPVRSAGLHSHPFGTSELRPPPPFPSQSSPPRPDLATRRGRTAAGGGARGPPASGSSPVAHDLSSLSLTELFEAAASIRQRQLALQQLQDQWHEQKRASPPLAGLASAHPKASPLPDISPPTPQPAALRISAPPPPAAAVHDFLPLQDSVGSEAPSSVSARDEDDTHAGGAVGKDSGESIALPRTASAAVPMNSSRMSTVDTSDGPTISRALFS